jgi:serine/threonine protein phosphatase PrpC
MSSSSYSSCEYLSYAQYSIASKSNEDRYSAVMDHSKRGVKSMASFGVYDGHMGVRHSISITHSVEQCNLCEINSLITYTAMLDVLR